MFKPMEGVRVLEGAQLTFVPSAGAVLAGCAFEVGHDLALRPVGQIVGVTGAEEKSRQLVANPVQFNREAPQLKRGPLFAGQTDEVLREVGISDEELLEFKISGAAT